MLLEIKIDNRFGQRLDNFLAVFYAKTPKRHVYRMIRKGRIKVKGVRCKNHCYVLQKGDLLLLPKPHEDSSDAAPSENLCNLIRSSIEASEQGFWVLNKPAGISVHQSNDELHGVVEVMRYLYGEAHLVHRLDRGTSGCLVIAKDYQSLVALSTIWKSRELEKVYQTLVEGVPKWSQQIVTKPLRRLEENGKLNKVVVDQSGKPAETNFKRLECFARSALLEVRILTGRTHQIRVHTSAIGYPIIGDKRYGSGLPKGLRRIFLHASELAFDFNHQHYQFKFALPEDLQDFLSRLNHDL